MNSTPVENLAPPVVTAGGRWWSDLIRIGWPLVVAVLIGLFASVVSGSNTVLIVNCGIAVIMAVSLTAVNGFTGQFSIGHAGFMAVGGYLTGSLVYYGTWKLFGDFNFHGGRLSYTGVAEFTGGLFAKGDLLFIASCLAGGIVAAFFGWLVGLPSLRLRGDYLAIVTLGFCEIVKSVLQGMPEQLTPWADEDALNKTSLIRLLPHTNGAAPLGFLPTYSSAFWVWVAAAMTVIATVRLKYSPYGRALLSIREDEIASRSVGVPVTKLKIRAFVFSAFFAGVAGGLASLQLGTINADQFGFAKSFDYVIMIVLGGLGSVSGAAVAAVLLTILPTILSDPPDLFPWGFAFVVPIAVLIYLFAPTPKRPLITLVVLCALWEIVRNTARAVGVDLATYQVSIYALTLIVMMIVRPKGLFGVYEIWDYIAAGWKTCQHRGEAT